MQCAFKLCLLFNYAVFSTCDQNVCENGGTCTQHVFEYKCNCPPSHSGSYCEIGEYVYAMTTLAVVGNLVICNIALPFFHNSSCNPKQLQCHPGQCSGGCSGPHSGHLGHMHTGGMLVLQNDIQAQAQGFLVTSSSSHTLFTKWVVQSIAILKTV